MYTHSLHLHLQGTPTVYTHIYEVHPQCTPTPARYTQCTPTPIRYTQEVPPQCTATATVPLTYSYACSYAFCKITAMLTYRLTDKLVAVLIPTLTPPLTYFYRCSYRFRYLYYGYTHTYSTYVFMPFFMYTYTLKNTHRSARTHTGRGTGKKWLATSSRTCKK
jgi:hypothetical protein